MRIVKEAEERKNEILDVAEHLFAEKGFENASTNDILKEIGIARGTLYYHFKSKEEILDAIIDRLTAEAMGKAAAIARDDSIPVLERLTKTIMALNIGDGTGEMVMEEIHKPQNALMHQKLQEKLLTEIDPLITGIVRDGVEQEVFHTEYPEELVEMAMLYSHVTFDGLNEMEPEQRMRKIVGFIYNLERLLGMEKGSLQQVIMPLF